MTDALPSEPTNDKGANPKRPGRKGRSIFNKNHTNGERLAPQSYEQVGLFHELQARIYNGTASVKEQNLFFVMEYENNGLLLKDLQEQESRGFLQSCFKADIEYYKDYLTKNRERYDRLRIETTPNWKRTADDKRKLREYQGRADSPVPAKDDNAKG